MTRPLRRILTDPVLRVLRTRSTTSDNNDDDVVEHRTEVFG